MSLEYNYLFFFLRGELVVLVYPIILRAGVYKFICYMVEKPINAYKTRFWPPNVTFHTFTYGILNKYVGSAILENKIKAFDGRSAALERDFLEAQ